MLMQHVARDNSGLSLTKRKDATCFLRCIMSVMTSSTIQACQQRAIGSKTIPFYDRKQGILILYQSTGIEKEDGSRQSLENHGKLDEIRRFCNKKFEEGHDLHRILASAGEYSRPNKKGRTSIRVLSDGNSIQPLFGFRSRKRSQESRGGRKRATKVLDRKDSRDRPRGKERDRA